MLPFLLPSSHIANFTLLDTSTLAYASLFALKYPSLENSVLTFYQAYPWVFRRTYLLSKGDASLAFIGLAVGCLLAAPTAKLMTNYYMKRRIAKNGVGLPENRLPYAIGAAIVAPISIFWFAWSGRAGIHWVVTVFSGVPFGWATLVLFVSFTSNPTGTWSWMREDKG